MTITKRFFTAEYRVEAAHRVIDSGRTIAEVARELGVGEQLLGRWVSWLGTPVTTEDRHADLPLADPGTTTRLPNQTIDPDQLAKTVITHSNEPPADARKTSQSKRIRGLTWRA